MITKCHLATGKLFLTCRQSSAAEALQPAQRPQQSKIDSSLSYSQRVTRWRGPRVIHYPLFQDSLALVHLMLGYPLFCVSRCSFVCSLFSAKKSSNTARQPKHSSKTLRTFKAASRSQFLSNHLQHLVMYLSRGATVASLGTWS